MLNGAGLDPALTGRAYSSALQRTAAAFLVALSTSLSRLSGLTLDGFGH